LARATWPISVPYGSQSDTSSSGTCDTRGSSDAGVISVANG
jgi:hypothetical protein